MIVLDAYEGHVKVSVQVPPPADGTPLAPSFSPDGQFVLCGCADGSVRVWATGKPPLGVGPSGMAEAGAAEGALVATWAPGNAGVPLLAQWAPKTMLVATGCTAGTLTLWLPDRNKLPREAQYAA